MTAKVSKKNSFSTLSYQVLWLGSGIRPPRTIPLGPDILLINTYNERMHLLMKSQYDHVALYAGDAFIMESDGGGVVLNHM
jgi:hypothetical protein